MFVILPSSSMRRFARSPNETDAVGFGAAVCTRRSKTRARIGCVMLLMMVAGAAVIDVTRAVVVAAVCNGDVGAARSCATCVD